MYHIQGCSHAMSVNVVWSHVHEFAFAHPNLCFKGSPSCRTNKISITSEYSVYYALYRTRVLDIVMKCDVVTVNCHRCRPVVWLFPVCGGPVVLCCVVDEWTRRCCCCSSTACCCWTLSLIERCRWQSGGGPAAAAAADAHKSPRFIAHTRYNRKNLISLRADF